MFYYKKNVQYELDYLVSDKIMIVFYSFLLVVIILFLFYMVIKQVIFDLFLNIFFFVRIFFFFRIFVFTATAVLSFVIYFTENSRSSTIKHSKTLKIGQNITHNTM